LKGLPSIAAKAALPPRISARKLITIDIYAQMDIRAGRLEDKNKPVLENALSVSPAFHPWQS
jgi:hypothetical protein